ncbi:MAG: T9SS type A sorting domain-containing protein [Chlorobi bacterium]|nr:T9SS type A sorting domain-containing protein [Chlorobiota bacterium]
MKHFLTVFIIFVILFLLKTPLLSQEVVVYDNTKTVSNIISKVIIYPNPVTGSEFYVKSDKLIKKVEVINVLGQKVKTINNQTDIPYNILVETSNLNKGMYMVQVTFEDGNKVINKIIVKKSLTQ